MYGLGVVFGVLTALNGSIALTSTWLLLAYGLLVLLIVNNLYADRWMRKVHAASASDEGEPTPELAAWRMSSGPIWSLAAAITITLGLVFVMVVKPAF